MAQLAFVAMAVSVIVAALESTPLRSQPASFAQTAPDAFRAGLRTVVAHWGASLEWRSDGTVSARLTGEDFELVARSAARCALSMRALLRSASAIASSTSDGDDLRDRAVAMARLGGDDVRLDEATAAALGEGFDLGRDGKSPFVRAARSRTAADARPCAPGDTLGRYVIEEWLGEGGMGAVFRARDTKLGRRVALKVLAPGKGGTDVEARFFREARAAATFTHPNVVGLYDVGDGAGDEARYLAMELVTGKTMRAFVGDASIPIAHRLRWLMDAARALSAAHAAGLVHRDIKPENVMVRDDGVVKVLDFGIARRVSEDAESEIAYLATLTGEGTVLGTPLYMAPEQMRGDPIDARVDQFAWAVMAYEVLTGERPWGKDVFQSLARMLTTEPRRIRSMHPEVPEGFAAAIERALSREAKQRFPSMDAMLSAIEAGATARPRRMARTLGLVAATLGLGASLAWGVRVARRAKSPPTTASAATNASSPLFADAMRFWHSGSSTLAKRTLDRAIANDSGLGAAHLRSALWGIATFAASPSDVRASFAKAQSLRASLDDRDRAMLDAFEPRMRQIPEISEWHQRLSELSARFPDDPEIAWWLARAKTVRGDDLPALAVLDSALTRAPSSAGALLAAKAEHLRWHHRLEEAIAAFDACLRASPSAIDCLAGRSRVRSVRGDCEGMETDARNWSALDPLDPDPYDAIAQVLYMRKAPRESVEEALHAKEEKLSKEARTEAEFSHRYRVAMAYGDFEGALRIAQDLHAQVPASAGLYAHLNSVSMIALAGDEAKADRLVGEVSVDFLKRARAWTPQSLNQAAYPLFVLDRAYYHGALTHDEFIAQRQDWLAMGEAAWERAGKPKNKSVLWLGAYGIAVHSEADAKEALATLGPYEPLPAPGAVSPEIDLAIAKVYAYGHKPDLAIQYARVLSDTCHVALEIPAGWMWAHLLLGMALEQQGHRTDAAKSYRLILDRWSAAKPGSRTADMARARLLSLEKTK